jgi:hypothetical protein
MYRKKLEAAEKKVLNYFITNIFLYLNGHFPAQKSALINK